MNSKRRWMVGMTATAGVAALVAGGAPRHALAQGTTAFQKHVIALADASGSVAAADLNGDGRVDVAAASNDEVVWYERGTRNSFWRKHPIARPTTESGPVWSDTLVVYDVDGDGRPDLIAATGNGSLVWYENSGAGDKPWTSHLIDHLPGVHAQLLEDLNRDGRPELVAHTGEAVVWYTLPRNPQKALPGDYKGDPAGRTYWDRHYLTRTGGTGGIRHLSFADVNADGRRDLCAAGGGTLAWFERPADATLIWTRHAVLDRAAGANHLFCADVDQDAKPDLIYARGGTGGISWLSGPRLQDEHPIDDKWLPDPEAVSAVDMNGDGRIDVVAFARESGRAAWWENDGKGKFTRRELDTAQCGLDLQTVDVDKDGDLDIVVAGGISKNLVWFENQRL